MICGLLAPRASRPAFVLAGAGVQQMVTGAPSNVRLQHRSFRPITGERPRWNGSRSGSELRRPRFCARAQRRGTMRILPDRPSPAAAATASLISLTVVRGLDRCVQLARGDQPGNGYPAGLNSGATTICPRDVTLNRMSLTGW
jgi:hypothetical protein